jgi:dTDP-4-amino-4,6-dideoxygalactose transaminase
MSEVAAAMGLSQLRSLPESLDRRRRIAKVYDARLGGEVGLSPLKPAVGVLPSYWRYVVVPAFPLNREKLREALAAEQIAIDWPYEPALHLQPVFQRLLGTRPGMLPRSEALLSRHFCLPVQAQMEPAEAEYVIDRVLYHLTAGTQRCVG